MPNSKYILSIDQGTSSSRSVIYNEFGNLICSFSEEFEQLYPKNGYVEHRPEDIWQTTLNTIHNSLKTQNKISAIAITNQRETTILWDKNTGKKIYNAIVWQDRRTAAYCSELKQKNYQKLITSKTGLLIDPYFSATKIKWILDNVDGARDIANKGNLCFGTIDTYLLWQLTSGRSFKTEPSNASRTMIYNIHDNCWDEELLDLFDIPRSILPEVCDSNSNFGLCDKSIFGLEVPIHGILGDQQAATFGQSCFFTGSAKATFGTGCFVMVNTGNKIVESKNNLLSTIGWRINNKTTYAMEGSVFIAGAAISWLKDKMGLINKSSECESIAASLPGNNGVYVIPAFTGIGAPHWDPDARGAIFGITRDTDKCDIVRATLESICYQTYDLIETIEKDSIKISELKIDGKMASNDWFCQFLADIINTKVHRPKNIETTSLGAALMAGLGIGLYSSFKDIENLWQNDRSFAANMPSNIRNELISQWTKYLGLLLNKKL